MGDDAEQADLFAGLDANNDGMITTGEWQWSRRSFARQDQNGDGQLTRAELTNAELSAAGAGAVGTSGTIANGRAVTVDAEPRLGRHRHRRPPRRHRVIQATGTVTLSTNASDVADPAARGRTAAHRLRRCRLSPPAR